MHESDLSLPTLIAANAVMAMASTLQAAVGIGLALLAVPLLALLDPRLAPGPMLLAGSVLALASALRERSAVQSAPMSAALAGLALGTLIAIGLLGVLDAQSFTRIFSVLILLAVALSLLNLHLPVTTLSLMVGGGISGIMGTMAGLHGPPLAIVLQNTRPEQARAMMGLLFFIAYLGSVAALAGIGRFGMADLALSAALLPGVLAGVVAGSRASRFINPQRLRIAILLTSCISALMLLLR